MAPCSPVSGLAAEYDLQLQLGHPPVHIVTPCLIALRSSNLLPRKRISGMFHSTHVSGNPSPTCLVFT